MTPKEKAKELVNKYYSDKCFNGNYAEDYNAKQCALIAVDEILKVSISYAGKDYEYWQEVKQEIEKL
jgi:hypothetical protein